MRPCWRKRVSSAALLASAALMAGCGAATKSDVIARGNAICESTLRDIRAVAPPAGASIASVGAYYDRVVPIFDREATQAAKLPRPALHRELLNRWIGDVEVEAGEYRALARAARLRDQAALATAAAALRLNSAPIDAAAYGLRNCATSPGTVRSS
jgi:hypothetical protein